MHYHVEVENEEWKDAQHKAAVALCQNVTVKGFRKGKAPFETAVKYVRPQDILERAADKMVQKAWKELLEDKIPDDYKDVRKIVTKASKYTYL